MNGAMDVLPSLTIAVSTLGSGIAKLSPLAEVPPGVSRLVVHQVPVPDPVVEAGADRLEQACPLTRVLRVRDQGLSRSRNMAMDACDTELLMIADDDVGHIWNGIDQIRAYFARHQDVGLCAGRAQGAGGSGKGPGSTEPQRMTRLNSGSVVSHVLSMRMDPVRKAQVRFDTGFGLGAGTEAMLGEEYIFVCDCLNAGLVGVKLPVDVTRHPHASTGDRWSDPSVARARGLVIRRVFGPAAPIAKLAFVAKHARRLRSLRNMAALVRA